MKNNIKKIILIILTLSILVIGISIVMDLDDSNNYGYKSDIVNIDNGDCLQIENEKITNLSQRMGKDSIAISKIKNTSNLNISQINLYYDEFDKNDSKVSDSEITIDITLAPEDVMEIQFVPKDYVNTIQITGYTYIVEDCEVIVNIKEKSVDIKENNKYLENSKNYEVLEINKLNDTSNGESSFSINIKNKSNKNLGNIVLKVGEIDDSDSIIKIDHVTYNSVLMPEQSSVVTGTLLNPNYNVKILGYTYDDMESKSNIDIDLITYKVNIVDDK